MGYSTNSYSSTVVTWSIGSCLAQALTHAVGKFHVIIYYSDLFMHSSECLWVMVSVHVVLYLCLCLSCVSACLCECVYLSVCQTVANISNE